MSKASHVRLKKVVKQVMSKRKLENHNTPVFDKIQRKGGLIDYENIEKYENYRNTLILKEKSNSNIKARMLDSLISKSENLAKLQLLNKKSPNSSLDDHVTLDVIAKSLEANGMFSYSEVLNLVAEKLRNLEKINTIIQSEDNTKAAKSRYTDELAKYKKELTNWAVDQYKVDSDERCNKGMVIRPKKGDVDKWLLDMYQEDIAFRADPDIKANFIESENIKIEGCPNASPEVPVNMKFKPSRNFFYQAIKTKT